MLVSRAEALVSTCSAFTSYFVSFHSFSRTCLSAEAGLSGAASCSQKLASKESTQRLHIPQTFYLMHKFLVFNIFVLRKSVYIFTLNSYLTIARL